MGKKHLLPFAPLNQTQLAILMTVIYSDLFDFPLTSTEIQRNLVNVGIYPEDFCTDEFNSALTSLIGVHLTASGDHITLAGREELIQIRQRRQRASLTIWRWAIRFSRILTWVPFVRLVAVSGSLAVNNVELRTPGEKQTNPPDIDYFIITEGGRLWIARFWLVLLRLISHYLTPFIPAAICPNYLLSLNSLEVNPQSLYTAHEVVQIVPLWGDEAYERFLKANSWAHQLLPRFKPPTHKQSLLAQSRPTLIAWIEKLLSGKAGDMFERTLYRFFHFFHRSIRARRLAHRLEPDRARRPLFRHQYLQSVREAFQPERQVLIQDGYAEVIQQRFRERMLQIIGDQLPESTLDRLFPPDIDSEAPVDRLYNQIHHIQAFQERYGGVG